MQISILGSLRVRVSDSELGQQDFAGVKPRELLALLLLARGRPVTKTALAEQLWPERQPKNVDGTLETYVSLVRKKLFPDRATARRVLTTSPGAYRFATDQVDFDLDRFDDLLERADQADHDRLALLTEATSLLRGDLLEDLGDPDWLLAERELYRDRATRCHLLAGEEMLVSHEFEAAIAQAECALRIRPYTEEAFRVLMVANHALGHVEGARVAFERCRTLLGDHLGYDPTTETEELAADVSAGVPAAEIISERASSRKSLSADQGPEPKNRRDPARELPFIGRATEIDAIERYVDDASSGAFRLVTIGGQPGIGRSALLQHLHDSLGGTVGRQAFTAHDSERPELPLSRSLSHALRGRAGEADAARYGAAPLLGEEQEARRNLLAVLSQHSPLVLLLDDLQWADVGTIKALAWLAVSAPELPVAVVATVRDSPSGARPSEALSSLKPHHTLSLSRLKVEATRLYGVDDDLVEATGGLPTLLADSWRWALAGRSGPSPSLRDSVLRSVRGLDTPHATVLQAMTSLDEPVHPFELSAGSSVQAPVVLASLDELCQLGILDRVGPKYRFQAPVVRDVVASTVSPRSG